MPLNINNNTELNTHGNVVTPDTNSMQSNETENPISAVSTTSQFDLPPLSPGTKQTATTAQPLHNQHFNNLQAKNKALGSKLEAANEQRSKFADANGAIAVLQIENERVTLLTQKMAKLIACDLTKNDNSLEASELIRNFLNLNAQDTIVQYNNKLQSLSMIALEKGLYKIANLLIKDDLIQGRYNLLHYRSAPESKNVFEELVHIVNTKPELASDFTEAQEQQHPHKTRYNTEDIAAASTEDEDSQLEAPFSTNLSTPPSGRAQEQYYYAGHNINHPRVNTNLELDNDENEELLDIDALLEDLASNDASTEYGDEQFSNLPRDPNSNLLLDAPKKSLLAPDWTLPQEAGIILFPELHGEHLPINDGIEA